MGEGLHGTAAQTAEPRMAGPGRTAQSEIACAEHRSSAESTGARTHPPSRVVIASVSPEIDAARYAIKRVLGQHLRVSAIVFAEGHDRIAAALLHRREGELPWCELRMTSGDGERFEAEFPMSELGRHEYTVQAWIDGFGSWRADLEKKLRANQDLSAELLSGAALVRGAAARANGADRRWLEEHAARLGRGTEGVERRVELALTPALRECMERHADRFGAAEYARILSVDVEPERAARGAWYELFPRSTAPVPGQHGSFRDVESWLPYIAGMGFDVLYLPPIHPIGTTHRKGRNNSRHAEAGDPGSPWAIGGAEGGHTAVHPALGTVEDFDHLVVRAHSLGLEVALDLAFQCSPDHPYVKSHPEWFRWRPDGTIQYAENPPKKYEDIFPLYFESPDWRELWDELLSVVRFWISRGIRIFRVDNPHTKPFAFWEWLIRTIRHSHPEVVFLAEAFTRKTVVHQLAKLGFSQSYTYFSWRNTKQELIEYFSELTRPEIVDYLRPNLFANTPDILPEYLQSGGRAGFQVRLVLAATLSRSYGIYGPAFELCVCESIPGTEEYLDSEKFQCRHWDLDSPGSLRVTIARINQIRRDSDAFGPDSRLRFFRIDNEDLLAYGRMSPGLEEILVVVVNLNPHYAQAGWLELPLEELGVGPADTYQAHDLLGDARYLWRGVRNYVALDPRAFPAHILRIRKKVRTEKDFDYFL
jgi:starch synthase (maltosyl-transferring)